MCRLIFCAGILSIFWFVCHGGHFNAIIHFRELPTEYEREFHKQIWVLRNPRKPLPNSAEAKRRTQKLKQVEKESAERKRLLRLLKKKAVKAAKKEADKDGRDEAEEEKEEEDVDISKVGVPTSAKGKNGNKCLIDFHNCYVRFFFF